MYRDGAGVKRDYGAAVRWFRKAAEQGYAAGQYNLADMYDRGAGVARDIEMAVFWYTKSAERGHAEAQYKLGYLYQYGLLGVTENCATARIWYRKAVEQGHGEAQTTVAELNCSKASESDYRAEVVANVVDPCLRSVITAMTGVKEPPPDLIETLRAQQANDIEVMIDTVSSVVQGRDLLARKAYYGTALESCQRPATQIAKARERPATPAPIELPFDTRYEVLADLPYKPYVLPLESLDFPGTLKPGAFFTVFGYTGIMGLPVYAVTVEEGTLGEVLIRRSDVVEGTVRRHDQP